MCHRCDVNNEPEQEECTVETSEISLPSPDSFKTQ